MSISRKFIPKTKGQTANTIVIEGATDPHLTSSLFSPIKINTNGAIYIEDQKGYGQYGFDIASGSEIISGSWYAIKTLEASNYKASSSVGDDFASNGNYNTGGYLNLPYGDLNIGDYIQIELNEGIIQAYRK